MSVDVDEFGRSDLHYAARDGDAAAAGRLIANGLDPDLSDVNGWTPLHFAAQAQSVEVARLLVEVGVRLEPQDKFGNTPLWRAVMNSKGRGEVIQLLRERGADPSLENGSGVSPVSLARTIGNYNIAQFFADLP